MHQLARISARRNGEDGADGFHARSMFIRMPNLFALAAHLLALRLARVRTCVIDRTSSVDLVCR